MRNTGKLFPLLLCLLLLLGCGGGPGEPAASTEAVRQTMSPIAGSEAESRPTERVESGLDEEIQAALDAHETKRFWRVEAPGSFPETVTLWSWSRPDARTLWPALRDGLLAEAADLTEKTYTVSDMIFCSFQLDGRKAEARIVPEGIEFSFLTLNRASAFAERLTAEEAERLGLPLQARSSANSAGKKLVTPTLEGLPLGHYTTPERLAVRLGVWQDGKLVHLSAPMEKPRAAGQISADTLLQPEEVEATLLFVNGLENDRSFQLVSVYQSCQPVYRADAVTGTIRPTWQVTGRQYLYDPPSGRYNTFPLELLVDAVTGEVFVAEGVIRSL